MVREIKSVSLQKRFQQIALSPFVFPVLTFAFVLLSLPVVYLMAQQQQDIRQNAASIATKSLAINTADISYSYASEEVLTYNNVVFSMVTAGLIIIMVLAVVIFFYRRKITSIQ